MKRLAVFLLAVSFSQYALARSRAPLPDAVWDGGALSSESLARGRTTAGNMSSPASGSENPASLNDASQNVSYATALVGLTSDVDKETVRASDPLRDRALQYIAMQGEKGVIFYEPISRFQGTEPTESVPSGTTDVDYEANAIGIAGAEPWRNGSFGLSIAYLYSSLGATAHVPGQPDIHTLDTSDGFRLNFGMRLPTGPLMWGLVLQNMPAFMWGSQYKRQMLPPSVRVGNTWRAYPGILFSVDWERRFYDEGGSPKNLLYLGSETFVGTTVVLRVGAYGENVGDPSDRHVTAGIGYRPRPGLELSYAYEAYEISTEKVKRSLISLKYPFDTSIEEPVQQ